MDSSKEGALWGALNVAFSAASWGRPVESVEPVEPVSGSAQAERLTVSVRKRTWSSQRAMPDRGPCTLHLSLSGFLGSGKLHEAIHGLSCHRWQMGDDEPRHSHTVDQHDLGGGWVVGSGCGGDGSK